MKKRWFSVLILLWFTLLLSNLTIWAEANSELKSIRFAAKEDRLEVNVEVSGDFSFDTFSLIGPRRLVIDLSPVQSIKASPLINVNACGVIRIRCGQFKLDVARVVFDLAEKVPSHKISRVAEGLKILFWQEEQIPAEVVVPEVREEIPPVEKRPGEKPTGVAPSQFPPLKPVTPSARKAGFIRLQGGVSLLPSSIILTQEDLNLYGETGSFTEKYDASLNLIFSISAAKAISVSTTQAKIGADFSLWSLSHKGVFEAAIPHPFLPNTPRNLPFEEKLSNSVFQITAFFLYPIIEKKKVSLWVGPAIGYGFGKFTTLEDFSLEDNPPFSSENLIITNTTLIEESISDFTFELRLELNFLLSSHTSFFAFTSLSYFNPKVANLGKRAKFLQIPFFLGLEFRL